jgi:hypothetical protein
MTRRDTPLVYMYTPRFLAGKFLDCLARHCLARHCLARLVLKIDAINVRGTLLGSFLLRLQRLSEAIATIWVRFSHQQPR